MFFAWGTKFKRAAVGWVADFCPLCRRLGTFRLFRVRRVHHVYWIPLGKGKYLGNEIECCACATVLGVAEARYPEVATSPPRDLEALVRQTLPPSDERLRDLVAREQRVAARQLAPLEREALLDEALEHGAVQVERQIRLLRYPPEARIAAWVAAGAFVLAILSQYLGWPASVTTPLGFLAIVCLVTFFCLALTAIRRHVRRVVEPALGRALSPLEPSVDELRAGIDRVSARWIAALRLKPQRLRAAIEAAEAILPG